MMEPTGKMPTGKCRLTCMCYLNFHPKGGIFSQGIYCRMLGNIFQTISTGSFHILYIRGIDKRNGSIYIIKYISWKWWIIDAYIPKATCYGRYCS